jgi:hypothetical protein
MSRTMTQTLTAYCDESGTQGHDFVIAGYLASASDWDAVEETWNEALGIAGLSEFRMSDCHHGHGEFKDRDDRIELREKFLSIIDSANVDGFAVRIDLETFGGVQRKLESSIRPRFNEEYLHGFSALTQFMADLVTDQPRDERIGFVFDENDQFRGRALEMFEAMKVMPAITYRHRLGGISFENSKLFVPLQAADTLAYRVHRDHFGALPSRRSTVQHGPRVRVALLGSDAIV